MTTGPQQAKPKIVILTAGGALSRVVVNGLVARLGPVVVIEEQPETKAQIIRRRVRLLGWPKAMSQAVAGLFIRLLEPRRRGRISEILRDNGLDASARNDIEVHRVASMNGPQARQLLQSLDPAVVGVYGTRMLKASTLGSVSAPFINYHAGINPKYRGQHPGYWALASGDPNNAGVTIHLVDQGVDTGGVLYQARCAFVPKDTISSYQYVQAARALPLFARAIEDALAGRLDPRDVELPSRQWFPPTLGNYLSNGIWRGVW